MLPMTVSWHRRRRWLSKVYILLLLTSLSIWNVVAVKKCSSLICIHIPRGGDKSNEKDERASRFRPSQSLHQFNQDIMEGAQSFESEDQPAQEKATAENHHKKRDRQGKQKDKIERAQNGRGGALTAVKTPPKRPPASPRTGIFSWLGPNNDSDNNRNEKQGQEEPSQQLDANANAVSTATTGSPDLAKLWWVNVWTQQLPDRPDYLTNNTSSETETSFAEAQNTVVKQPPDNDAEVGKKHGPSMTSGDEARGHRKESYGKKKKNALSMDEEDRWSDEIKQSVVQEEPEQLAPTYVSSGYWAAIDGLASLGLSAIHPAFRISRPLRPIRKATARVTGLHGALSGKPRKKANQTNIVMPEKELGEEDLAMVRRRIAAINKARVGVEKVSKDETKNIPRRKGGWWGRRESVDIPEVKHIATVAAEMTIPSIRKTPEELEEEQRRKERVQEIDRLMSEAQKELQRLACEKDVLQRRPNPLWNYSTEKVLKRKGNQTTITTRKFSFPPDDVVSEYLDFLLSSGRLIKMNHTDLWQNDVVEEDEDESIGDDIGHTSANDDKRSRNGGSGGGFWILRQSLGKGSTLGEKIGEATEQAAYRSIAKAVMGALARSISAIHGVNIMTHTDIRLSMEATPDLPPMSKQGIIPGGRNPNYARDALQGAMRRGAQRNKGKRYRYDLSEDAFVQRDAVVEMLISHCQISAPLLTLFPLAWQRAMLGNIVTLVTAVVADFCEGVQFEILGHRLSFSFKPITESDMINHIAMAGPNFNRRSMQSDQFEEAVQATADDVSENLKFLDRWHERLLGSGVLRSQIANLIARLVLTLAGEVLSGAQMDLWAAQASGPRMVAGLEFRTTSGYMEEIE